jgi:adenine-specific DNA-methyltransferase
MPLSNEQSRFARHLRQQSTDAEARLWYHLRGRRLRGFRFRRQHPIGPYFADFVCLERCLIVELDGGQHNTENGLVHDAIRSDFLDARGFEVLRFWNNDVLQNTRGVLEVIARRLKAAQDPHPRFAQDPHPAFGRPLPQAGEVSKRER